jgi:hypothetical protein
MVACNLMFAEPTQLIQADLGDVLPVCLSKHTQSLTVPELPGIIQLISFGNRLPCRGQSLLSMQALLILKEGNLNLEMYRPIISAPSAVSSP